MMQCQCECVSSLCFCCPLLYLTLLVAVALTIANVIGAVVIVTVLEHYFRTSSALCMLSLY